MREQLLASGIELPEDARRRFEVELARVFDDLGLRAEARQHRHLPRERGAEGVDGLDAKAVRDLAGVGKLLEDALSHLGRGLLGEGDRENFFSFLYRLQEFQESPDEEVRFPGARRRLDDEGAAHIERAVSQSGVPHLLHHSSISSSASTLIFSYTRQSVSRPQ